VLDDGIRTGLFNCSDPAIAVRALMGILNWTLTWYRQDGPLAIEQIADQYSNLLLNGLMK
jgi:hypothetical protein